MNLMARFQRPWRCDVAAFGVDFRRARREWLYDTPMVQKTWVAILLFLLLFVLHFVFQTLGAFGAFKFYYGGAIAEFVAAADASTPSASADALKSGVVGIGPAALMTCLMAWVLAHISRHAPGNSLSLYWPKLGYGGWIAVVGGFAVTMYFAYIGIMLALGIDPATYSPTSGLNDPASKAGMVERLMVEISKDRVASALALPGVMLLVPAAEEMLFRGVLFSAIANSFIGRWGAVVITAALWAVIHIVSAPWLFVLVIFVMGLVLGLLLLRFGSLWVTIACHALWNSMTSAAIFAMAT